jgi:hypothetical protein
LISLVGKKNYLGVASGTFTAMPLISQMACMAIAMIFIAIFIGSEPIPPPSIMSFF